MSHAPIALLAALLAGEAGRPDGAAVASLEPALHGLGTLSSHALPPPPGVVVRRTERYGNVAIDHAKHLAVRAPCLACHGKGPVSKIQFTPQAAHEACIGCHQTRSSGPTQCAGCHVRGSEQARAGTALPGSPPAAAEQTKAEPAAPPAPGAGTALPPPPPPPSLPESAPPAPEAGPAVRQLVELGYLAGTGFGPSLRVSSRRERLLVMYSFERVARPGEARLVGLLGVGLSHRLPNGWELVAVAMGGFDAIEEPAVTIAPALAARAGVEWRPRRGRLDTIHLGVTGVVDLASGRAFGRDVPRTALFATFATGLRVRGKGAR